MNSVAHSNLTTFSEMIATTELQRSPLTTILDAVPELFFLLDSDGQIIMANKAAANCYGGELTQHRSARRLLFHQYGEGKLLPLELRPAPDCLLVLVDADGNQKFVESSITACQYRGRQCFAVVARVVSFTSGNKLARYLSRAIARLSANNRNLRQQVNTDLLTGALSRRGIEQALLRETAVSRRKGTSVCCSLVDVDNFKQINDRYGHAVGDLVLRRIVDTLRASVRLSDYIGRTGGDEFLILLPETEIHTACAVLRRCAEVICSNPVRAGTQTVNVSISAGVAELPLGEMQPNVEAILKLVDSSLQASKLAGKNTVSAASVQPPKANSLEKSA